MDLIYTNAAREEQGIIMNYTLDLEESIESESCTFEIGMASEDNLLEVGSLVYIEHTEFGGIVDALMVDTEAQTITATGRTFRGILGSKIILDPTERTMDANAILSSLISTYHLTSLFSVSTATSATITHSFTRYMKLYEAIERMLSDNGLKLDVKYSLSEHKAILSAVPIDDYSNEAELTSDRFAFKLRTGINPANHSIAVGASGAPVQRYLWPDGSIKLTQYYTDDKEIVRVDVDEDETDQQKLIEKAIELLTEDNDVNSLSISVADLNADIGDKFTALDIQTGLSMTQYVTRKVVKINHDIIQYQYEVGEITL